MFDRDPPPADLLIVDEAQHDAALSMANLHGRIRPSMVLGLTATPFRTDRFKLCFEKVLRDAGIHALIQEGYLSPYHHYTIPTYDPVSVAHTYLREPRHWGRSLIFFHRHRQCVECRDRLAAEGITAEVVTAKTDRQRQIASFAQGQIHVPVNMLILSEGFDCPALQTVFCRPRVNRDRFASVSTNVNQLATGQLRPDGNIYPLDKTWTVVEDHCRPG